MKISLELRDLSIEQLKKQAAFYASSENSSDRLGDAKHFEDELILRDVYAQEQVNTAMCLWEAALSLQFDIPELDAHWGLVGTVAMRYEIMSLVTTCELSWRMGAIDDTQREPFDWDHCRTFLAQHYTPTVVAPVGLVDEIAAFLRKHNMAPTTFGRLAMRDPHFVGRVNRNQRMWESTKTKAREFMASYTP